MQNIKKSNMFYLFLTLSRIPMSRNELIQFRQRR